MGEGLFWGLEREGFGEGQEPYAALTSPSARTNSVAGDPEPQHPGHGDNRGPFPSCQPGVFLNQEPGVNLLWALAVPRRSERPSFPPAERWQQSAIWALRIHYQAHPGVGGEETGCQTSHAKLPLEMGLEFKREEGERESAARRG